MQNHQHYTMANYYHIIELNNAAVAMIKSRRYKSAISVLTRALREHQLQQAQQQEPSNCVLKQDDCKKRSLDQVMLQSHRSDAHMLLNAGQDMKEQGINRDAEQYRYSHGIFIPSNMDSSLVPSIMIFNMALVHHLYADQCHDRRKSLTKAHRLYELAYDSQRQETSSSNFLFVLATVNNLGLIHGELNNKEKSKMCFEHLLSILMFVVDSQQQSSNDYCFDGFLRNATWTNNHAALHAGAA